MTAPWKWNPCVNHRDEEDEPHAKQFIKEYFSHNDRRILLLVGAGFDPRSAVISELLHEVAKERIYGFLIREERLNPSDKLKELAEHNVNRMKSLLQDHSLASINIFSTDGAVIGGREIVNSLVNFSFEGFTDVIVDVSAMSIGVSYPMIRYLFEMATNDNKIKNLHVMIADNPTMDCKIVPIASDKAGTVSGFQGGLGLDRTTEAVKLWLPQLMIGKKMILEKIYNYIGEPKDVCPILPLSADNLRIADELFYCYRDELESTWEIDERNIIYTDDRNPLDLYRSILRIDDARKGVFAEIRGSITVLTPIGSKASAIGALMAAIERDFPIVYVEANGYDINFDELEQAVENENNKIIHVWLHGEAYS